MPDVPDKLPRNDVAAPLQREVLWVAMLGVVFLATMAAGLSAPAGTTMALAWFALGLLCWGVVLWQCYRRLHLNCSVPNGRHYCTLGVGNRVTLLRGLLIAATAGFLVIAPGAISRWVLYLPAAFYTAAVVGDWLDGYLARWQQQTTRLGAELDTVLDAFGLLVAPLLAVMLGKLHFSYLLVSVAYYLFEWGKAWRRRYRRPVYALPPSRLRRYLAGMQMVLVALALWPPLADSLTRGLGIILMLPLLFGFCRDWLAVSGRRHVPRALDS
ncbi:MAG: CDP-alcohol phosphatidyltransferase family protein [Chromatocurvus sp.]